VPSSGAATVKTLRISSVTWLKLVCTWSPPQVTFRVRRHYSQSSTSGLVRLELPHLPGAAAPFGQRGLPNFTET